jgi:CheY-like chemotaxis protein
MKLDYRILWLDDKMDVILEGEYDSEIKDFLFEEGFNPIIVTVKNEEEFFKNLNDSYDLIMTDYHLNEKEGTTRDGDTIIKEVREKNSIFTEIMFYSAQGEVVDTVKLDRITFVDTRKIVGNNHYEKLISKALSLIQLTIKKFQHIVAMRGMIMSETSGLDMQMLDIIKKSLGNDKVNFDELAPKIYDELNQLYSSKSKFVDECRDSGKFKSLVKDTFVFSAEYKIKTLGQILNNLDLKDFSEEYKEEINSIRNKFAHALLLKDENGREYFKHGESGLTFDQDLCKKIRLNIIKHKNNFDELHSALD